MQYKISYQVCTTGPVIGEQPQNNTCLSLCLQCKVGHQTTAPTLQCKFLQATLTQSVQRERLGINPFTAPASNISGQKDARKDAPANSTFFGPTMHLVSMLRVLMKILSHRCQCRNEDEKLNGFRFRTFIGSFGTWHHGREGVKLHAGTNLCYFGSPLVADSVGVEREGEKGAVHLETLHGSKEALHLLFC